MPSIYPRERARPAIVPDVMVPRSVVRKAFLLWAFVGVLVAVVLLATQASAVGGSSGLLQVGETSELRPMIEAELGPVPLAPGLGHDGQISYAMGLDLAGNEVPDLLDHGVYRYRRILYPLIASVFGILDGYALLVGMIAVTIVSASVAAGAAAATLVAGGRSEWLALAVVLNPGVWLSIRLLTSDVPALALMLLALLILVEGIRRPLTALTLSVLAKDVYFATPLGLALGRDRRRWRLALVPLAALAVWMIWLTITMGEPFSGRGNLTWPFIGMIDAATNWSSFSLEGWFYLIFALSSVFGGLAYAALAKSWLRFPILIWSLLGVVSSNSVWDFANNAARAFAPIVVLISLSLTAPYVSQHSGSDKKPFER